MTVSAPARHAGCLVRRLRRRAGRRTRRSSASPCSAATPPRRPARSRLSLTIIGHVAPGAAVRRNGARPGDGIWVTGTIGDGALGLLRPRRANWPTRPASSPTATACRSPRLGLRARRHRLGRRWMCPTGWCRTSAICAAPAGWRPRSMRRLVPLLAAARAARPDWLAAVPDRRRRLRAAAGGAAGARGRAARGGRARPASRSRRIGRFRRRPRRCACWPRTGAACASPAAAGAISDARRVAAVRDEPSPAPRSC